MVVANTHLLWMFLLVAPYCFDAKAAKAIGLGGLRLGVRQECNRPLLIPRVVLDPICVYDWQFRPISVFWDKTLSKERIERRKLREHMRRQGAQVEIFREALRQRRQRRAASSSLPTVPIIERAERSNGDGASGDGKKRA